jgi:hypothetical protein
VDEDQAHAACGWENRISLAQARLRLQHGGRLDPPIRHNPIRRRQDWHPTRWRKPVLTVELDGHSAAPNLTP